jgi:predicted transcriptional regulator
METIHTIATPELTAKLNKSEIDILHYIEGWLPTLTSWSVKELSYKCNMFTSEATSSVDMLILHGLLENTDRDQMMGRMITVTDDGAKWLSENREIIYSIKHMNDTDLYDDTEIAES